MTYTEWMFFGLLAVGVVLRRRDGQSGTYRMPGVPWLPLAFAGAALAIVINQFVHDPAESVVGLSLVLVGAPVYWVRTRFGSGSSARGEQA